MSLPVDPRSFPALPPSEVEWEELLVKLELAPRAFRIAVSEQDATDLSVVRVLLDAAMWEASLRGILDAMRDGEETPASAPAPPSPEKSGAGGPAGYFLDEFAALRARNFAAVQRRGVDVWEWKTSGGVLGPGPVTAYQVLSATVRMDGLRLRAIRSGGRRGEKNA